MSAFTTKTAFYLQKRIVITCGSFGTENSDKIELPSRPVMEANVRLLDPISIDRIESALLIRIVSGISQLAGTTENGFRLLSGIFVFPPALNNKELFVF